VAYDYFQIFLLPAVCFAIVQFTVFISN